MNEAYLHTIKDLVKRGHGGGLYGRIADFEIVAISAVVLELVKLSTRPTKDQLRKEVEEANKHGG